MPELPEVEVLVRYLRPLLKRRTIRGVDVLRPKTLAGTPARTFERTLTGATFTDLHRRGKYLVFQLSVGPRAVPARSTPFTAPIAAPDTLLPAPRSLSSSSSFPSFPSVTPPLSTPCRAEVRRRRSNSQLSTLNSQLSSWATSA